MYFDNFPKISYSFPQDGYNNIELMDIFRRVAFKFAPYTLTTRPTEIYLPSAGETVDTIAEKFYGDSEYWWLVCLFNNIVNPFNALPRTGDDYEFSENYKRANSIHVERNGGVLYRGINRGDIIIKAHPTQTTTVNLPNGQAFYENVPKPLMASETEPTAFAVVDSVDRTTQELVLRGNGAKHFHAGDVKFLVVAPYGLQRETYKQSFDFNTISKNYLVLWGTVKKVHTPDTRLFGFREKHTGFFKDPMIVTATGSRRTTNFYQAQPLADQNATLEPSDNWNYSGTLIAGYLNYVGGTGESGNNWNERYEAVTYNDIRSMQGAGDINPAVEGTDARLRLLIPEYKGEALDLFKRTLSDNRYNIQEFSNIM